MSLIERTRLRAARAPSPELRLGIGDDCAIVRPAAGDELTVTTDLSIEGRHFRLDWHPAQSVGHRALARGLSDLAGMGARPVAAFLSLAVPRNLVQKAKVGGTEPWIDRFLDGFLSLARAYQVPLAGGDLAESTLAVADIVATGAVAQGAALLRSGARAGDVVYVTGALGGAAVGFACLSRLASARMRDQSTGRRRLTVHLPEEFDEVLQPHLYPKPRVAQGLWLARNSMASAAIDLSDGLSTDLTHLCKGSGVSAEIDSCLLPVAPGATEAQVLHGGEDYELLFTAPAAARVPLSIGGVPVTRIGRIFARNKTAARKGVRKSTAPLVTLVTPRGPMPLAPQGWQHFS